MTSVQNVISISGGKDSTATEAWAPIAGYGGRYEVSSQGRIRSMDRSVPHASGRGESYLRGKVLSLTTRRSGYVSVVLSRHGIVKTHDVHVLVARAFVSGYAPGMEVNHRDGNKANNDARNLEWTTRGANNLHRYRELGGAPVRSWAGKSGAAHNRSKAVVGVPLGGGEPIHFGSTREAARAGFTQSAVAACCRGEKQQHKGYRWRYE